MSIQEYLKELKEEVLEREMLEANERLVPLRRKLDQEMEEKLRGIQ